MLEFHIENLYTKVEKKKAAKDELTELHNILSVKVQGYYFSPQFRRGLWDGYKRFFNLLTGTFYTGLLYYATSKLISKFNIIDDRVGAPHKNNPLNLREIELRDYQIHMITEAITKGRGIISAPPNSGKTECAAGIIQVLGLPALFFTHRLTLLRQTRDRFEKRLGVKVGLVGGGTEEWEDITVVSIQTAYKKIDEFKDRFKKIPLIFADECFPGNAKVLLDCETFTTIKEIFSNNKITQVLSYNEREHTLEKCKILRKIRRNVVKPKVLSLYVKLEEKVTRVCCTPNHKVYVNGIYKRADEIKMGDIVKILDVDSKKTFICKKCGKIMKGGPSLGGHQASHVSQRKLYNKTISIKCRKCGIIFNSRSDYKKHHMKVHYGSTSQFRENILKAGRIRGDSMKGARNPSKNPLVKKKQSIRQKAWWANMNKEERDWRLKTFMNASIWSGMPTSLERAIMYLKIQGLKYTGNGEFWVTLPNGKNKNPDFVYGKKVIEVMDIEYWHKGENFDDLVRLYKEIGYDCLILSAQDIKDFNLKGRIEKFLFNHEGEVVRIRKHAAKSKFLYNLEIENNHNYFANRILVSNCHHIAAKSFEKVLKTCAESSYKFGLSATPLLRDDISNLTVRGLMGDEIVTVTNQELIAAGVSAFPSVYLLSVEEPKIPSHYTFDQAYDEGIMLNDYRNGLIVSSAERFLNNGKSVFILVWRIAHGEVLLDMLRERGIESEFISGGKIEHTESVLKRFESKDLKCVVSSTISDEGLDVPSVDVLIIATGFKAPLKTIQRVGRGLRKKVVGENVVSIIDFIDFHNKNYLFKHSHKRLETYVNMGIDIFEVKNNNWDDLVKV